MISDPVGRVALDIWPGLRPDFWRVCLRDTTERVAAVDVVTSSEELAKQLASAMAHELGRRGIPAQVVTRNYDGAAVTWRSYGPVEAQS